MRRKFWLWVHDTLERAWHWVYYKKLVRPLPRIMDFPIIYHVEYINSKTGKVSDPRP